MFESLQGIRVQAGRIGHVYVFGSMSGEMYIFNRLLHNGAQNIVQIVDNMTKCQVVVRKVSKEKRAVRDARDLANVPEDNELRILDYLKTLLLNPVYLLTGLTPRWSECIYHEKALQSSGCGLQTECRYISYWTFYNAGNVSSVIENWDSGSMADDIEGEVFPVSFVARCIAQVCETLHYMYQAGHEAVYHCDLHLGNIFVHYDSHPGNDGLPDFYIGGFSLARTASEDQAHGEAQRCCNLNPGPGTAAAGQRRRWDVARFLDALEQLTQRTVVPWPDSGAAEWPNLPPPSDQAVELKRLIDMLKFLDAQDEEAAHHPTSRPPSLVEVVREAKRVEEFALQAEMDTVPFEAVSEWGYLQLARSEEEKPYVFTSEEWAAPLDWRVAQAENYGRINIEGGPWTLVESE